MGRIALVNNSDIESKSAKMRRHDVDWIRVHALGLLIIFHGVVGFQPWATDDDVNNNFWC